MQQLDKIADNKKLIDGYVKSLVSIKDTADSSEPTFAHQDKGMDYLEELASYREVIDKISAVMENLK